MSIKNSVAYAALVVLPVALIVGVLLASPDQGAALGVPDHVQPVSADQAFLRLPLFLGQVLLILTLAHGLGWLMRFVGQPRVVGEILAGLILGPSLMGHVWPELFDWLFPHGSVRFTTGLSQIGLVLFMFLAGLELNFQRFPVRMGQTLVISHAGIALPTLGGVLLGPVLYAKYSTPLSTLTQFSLFLGCAMSVTALPVLVRILVERGLFGTAFGSGALACAATADLTAWALLAATLAFENEAKAAFQTIWAFLGGLLIFLALMLLLVRPAITAYWKKREAAQRDFGPYDLLLVIFIILACGLAMEFLNVHAILGALIAGLVMPRSPRLQADIRLRFEDLLTVLLLPLFFAYMGFRTNFWLLQPPDEYVLLFQIIAVATVGKLGGTFLAGKLLGLPSREALALGALMNARGTVELVLLSIGLQDGIMTSSLFTIMVLMAVVTTIMTNPLLVLVSPKLSKTTVAGTAIESDR